MNNIDMLFPDGEVHNILPYRISSFVMNEGLFYLLEYNDRTKRAGGFTVLRRDGQGFKKIPLSGNNAYNELVDKIYRGLIKVNPADFAILSGITYIGCAEPVASVDKLGLDTLLDRKLLVKLYTNNKGEIMMDGYLISNIFGIDVDKEKKCVLTDGQLMYVMENFEIEWESLNNIKYNTSSPEPPSGGDTQLNYNYSPPEAPGGGNNLRFDKKYPSSGGKYKGGGLSGEPPHDDTIFNNFGSVGKAKNVYVSIVALEDISSTLRYDLNSLSNGVSAFATENGVNFTRVYGIDEQVFSYLVEQLDKTDNINELEPLEIVVDGNKIVYQFIGQYKNYGNMITKINVNSINNNDKYSLEAALMGYVDSEGYVSTQETAINIKSLKDKEQVKYL